MPPPAALALDLDGTLLEADGSLADESVAALDALRERGVIIALLSGRMIPAMLPFWQRLRLDTPLTGYNGGLVRYPDGETLVHTPVAVEDARAVLAECEAAGIHVNAYLDDTLYAPDDAGGLAQWYSEYYGVPLTVVSRLSAWLSKPTTKLLAIAQDVATYPAMCEKLMAIAEGRKVHLVQSGERFVEVLHPAVDKGSALAVVAEDLGVPMAQWVAFGDGENDVTMLAAAGIGVAVEKSQAAAHPHAKQLPSGSRGIEQIAALFP